MKKLLPPLDYLVAFEAAGLLGSFAAASRELKISETAISRKVKLLERHYNATLFVRGHRSIQLTQLGHRLLASVTKNLDELRETSQDLFGQHIDSSITLAATNSVAALWLMPRLLKFNKTNARVKINLVSSDSDEECLADDVHLSILRGDGVWPGYRSRLLFGETVYPVCSPDHPAAERKMEINDFPNAELIDVQNQHTEWIDWKLWLRSNGLKHTELDQATLFNTYPLAVQASVDGLGIALGWGHLVDQLLDSGRLVRVKCDSPVRTKSGYYLLTPENRKSIPEIDVVAQWLLRESAMRKRFNMQSIPAIS